jgi:tRNA A-37 threonylcarbamoyl transferase component Bud32
MTFERTELAGSHAEARLPANERAQFLTVSEGNISGVLHRKWQHAAGDLPGLLADLQQNPGEILRKGGGQGTTSRRDFDGVLAFIKVYPPGKLHRRLRDVLLKSRAVREWESNCALEALGIHTACVLAALTRRDGPFSHTHFFVTQAAPGEDLHGLLKGLRQDELRRRELLRFTGGYVAFLHRTGFWHAHLHAKHIFLTPERRVTLIDLERSMIRKQLPAAKVERNLRQIRKSLSALVPKPELEEFERGYRED